MDYKKLAEDMVRIFAPDPETYGTYPAELVASTTKAGKLENPKKGITIRRRWTNSLIENHLRGNGPRFGIAPINSTTGTIRMMACDVDKDQNGTAIYETVNFKELSKKLFDIHPMLFVLRSKSGGPHIYAFFREDSHAGKIKPKMRELVTSLGYGGTHEFFPKQETIDIANDEFGNWINMPYYKADEPIQYGFDPQTGDALTIEEFVAHATHRAGTEAEFLNIKLAGDDFCSDGPPCIQRIFGMGLQHNRNVTLRHTSTYLRSKYPEDWHIKLEEYNNMWPEPLPASELVDIIRSVGKKSYGYSCEDEPMLGHCSRPLCNQRKFGVNGAGAHPFIVSLTKHNSDPPLWWVYFDDGKKMRCDTDDLQNSRGFQRRAMEQLNQVPNVYKQDQWTKVLQQLMKNVTIVEVPENATQFGLMRQYIHDYLTLTSPGETYEELLSHKHVLIDDVFCFQLPDLIAWLSKKSFGIAKPELITLTLVQMGAKYREQKIHNSKRTIYTIPAKDVTGHAEELPMPDLEQPTSY
jgi:hypothetical protein